MNTQQNIAITLRTKDRLAIALREINHEELAQNAEQGLYDELESTLAEPLAQLTFELGKINTKESGALAIKIINGEYDNNNNEIKLWEKEVIAFQKRITS